MNVNCIICSDLLTPAEEIYTTPCGHLFHYVCLTQWIERSRTCPQCRNKTTERSIHRVYFNLTDTDSVTENVGTLQSKVDNLRFQINLKEKDIKGYMDKYESVRANNCGLKTEIKNLEDKNKVSESAIHALKEQISYFKQKGKECNRLSEEVVRLKEKLKDLENVELVLNGSRDEVKDMLSQNRDLHSLSILVATLKKVLIETDRKYKQISSDLKHAQNSVSRYRKEIVEIEQQNSKLRNNIESHKHCVKERQYLKRKISNSEAKSSSHEINSPKIRILDNSVAQSALKDDSRTVSLNETFTINERVKQIRESDSPYLPIKSSNVGLSPLLKSRYTTLKSSSSQKGTNRFKILKQSPKSDLKLPSKEYSYDGLGGHSKQDNFPSPKSLSKFKKLKHSSTSSKVKKKTRNVKTKSQATIECTVTVIFFMYLVYLFVLIK